MPKISRLVGSVHHTQLIQLRVITSRGVHLTDSPTSTRSIFWLCCAGVRGEGRSVNKGSQAVSYFASRSFWVWQKLIFGVNVLALLYISRRPFKASNHVLVYTCYCSMWFHYWAGGQPRRQTRSPIDEKNFSRMYWRGQSVDYYRQ